MRKIFDDIHKFVIEFDDEDYTTDADVRYLNKLTKAGIDFEIDEETDQVIVYRGDLE